MTGREFFDAHGEDDEKCKLLQGMDEQTLMEWEAESVSAFSPGVVSDDELLYQQVLDPTQIAPNGEGLKSMAFDVCRSHGLSTNRLAHSTIQELIEKGTARANGWNNQYPEKPPRTLWGFVPYKVSDIRAILCRDAGTRGLFVFDTADDDDPSHAEVCQGGRNSSNKLQARNVRSSLYLLAKQRLVSVAELAQPM